MGWQIYAAQTKEKQTKEDIAYCYVITLLLGRMTRLFLYFELQKKGLQKWQLQETENPSTALKQRALDCAPLDFLLPQRLDTTTNIGRLSGLYMRQEQNIC